MKNLKRMVQKDYEEFMRASVANLNAMGKERVIHARRVLFESLYEIPQHCLEWGIQYIFGLMKWV